MMIISSTELKSNMNKYLDLLDNEDILITKNGRKVAKITKEPEEESDMKNIYSLYGILKDSKLSKLSDGELKKIIRKERNNRYDSRD